jgi:hypothetical protein
LPGRSWLRAARVMRQYRDEAASFGIRTDPLRLYPGGSASRTAVRLLWRLSAALPSQREYFRQLRESAWEREIVWEEPELPAATERPQCEDDEESSVPAPARS